MGCAYGSRSLRRVGNLRSPHSIGVIADTEFGAVRGTLDGSTNVWRGIRYAAPPRGALRFRAPQPLAPTTALAGATDGDPLTTRPRASTFLRRTAEHLNEDCLFLTVWSPTGGASRKPVLFWIQSDETLRGAEAERPFSGRSLAENGDVVVVSVSSRLGVLGFADFSSFSTREHQFESNLAVRDVIAALEWVHGNIAQFGGDPSRVTIGGESSGADLVTTLLAVPTAAGLFHRAIAQSPSAVTAHSSEQAEGSAAMLLAMLRVHPSDVHRLRETPPAALLAAASRLIAATRLSEVTRSTEALRVGAETISSAPAPAGSRTPFAPVIDGSLVPEHPLTALQQGRAHRVPLVIGSNQDAETGIAAVMSAPHDGHLTHHSDTRIDTRMPALAIAEAHSRFAPVWLYRFDYSPLWRRALGSAAPRSSELPYLWGALPRGPFAALDDLATRSAAKRLSARLQHRWMSFAKLGIPTHAAGETVWTSYDEHRATLVFDRQDSLVNDLDAPLRASEISPLRYAGATQR